MGLRRAATVVVGIALALVAAGLPTAAPTSAAVTAFTDVPQSASYAADARWMVDQGITTAPSGRFRPTATVPRQDLAVYLYRVSHPGGSIPACTAKPFEDVPTSSSRCGAIAWLKTAGIVPAGTAFQPLASATREFLATTVSGLNGTPPRACTSPPFPDVRVTARGCAAVAWLRSKGIAVGLPDGTFRGGSAATRAATATFLHGWSDVRWPVVGADVSHPQCGGPLPTGQAFGVVGVNAGTATTTNPCLAEQLAWAQRSVGGTGQPRVQLYVNTANPGGLKTSSWPRSGKNRYGTCTGSNSTACAYQYGWERARDDVRLRGVSRPQDFVWWLDVELENSWDLTAAGAARNVAVLEGMVEQLRGAGVAGVGLYSTGHQWQTIVRSSVPANSSLTGLPSWLAGASNLSGARAGCQHSPLTRGGRVVMVQYVDAFDRNHSCT